MGEWGMGRLFFFFFFYSVRGGESYGGEERKGRKGKISPESGLEFGKLQVLI